MVSALALNFEAVDLTFGQNKKFLIAMSLLTMPHLFHVRSYCILYINTIHAGYMNRCVFAKWNGGISVFAIVGCMELD